MYFQRLFLKTFEVNIFSILPTSNLSRSLDISNPYNHLYSVFIENKENLRSHVWHILIKASNSCMANNVHLNVLSKEETCKGSEILQDRSEVNIKQELVKRVNLNDGKNSRVTNVYQMHWNQRTIFIFYLLLFYIFGHLFWKSILECKLETLELHYI